MFAIGVCCRKHLGKDKQKIDKIKKVYKEKGRKVKIKEDPKD
jgi:hypothetical protein